MKKKITAILAIIIGTALLAGCGEEGSSSSDVSSYAESAPESAYQESKTTNGTLGNSLDSGAGSSDAEAGTGAAEESTADAESAASPVLNSDKIVYTANVSMSTKEFDKALKQIKAISAKYGAIVQSENYSEGDTNWYLDGDGNRNGGTRNYSVSLRVPSKNYNAMLEATGSMNAVIDSKDSNAENISQQYSDKQAEIKSLEAELSQLQAIMEQATKVQDIMDIQKRITEVQTQLNQDRSDITRMDTDVAYSYVNISMQEVSVYEDKPDTVEMTFAEKLISNFKKSLTEFAGFCRDLVLFIVRNWIKLLILAVIVIIIIRTGRSSRKKRLEKKSETPVKKPEGGYQGKPEFKKTQDETENKDKKE